MTQEAFRGILGFAMRPYLFGQKAEKHGSNPICVMREMFILKYIFVWVDFVIW